MGLAVKASGTQAAEVGTTHTLVDTDDAGTYVLNANLANMVADDRVEIAVSKKVLAGDGSPSQTRLAAWKHAQADVLAQSPAFVCPHGVKVTLKQTDGVGRNFAWSLDQLDG